MIIHLRVLRHTRVISVRTSKISFIWCTSDKDTVGSRANLAKGYKDRNSLPKVKKNQKGVSIPILLNQSVLIIRKLLKILQAFM